MLKEAIEKIESLVKTPKTIERFGQEFDLIPNGWTRVASVSPAERIPLTTLSGLVALAMSLVDHKDSLILAVSGFRAVTLYGHLEDDGSRENYGHAVACVPAVFDRAMGIPWCEPQDAVVSLLSNFQESPAQADLLAILGHVKAGRSIDVEDDGVSQSVTIQKSAAFVGQQKVGPFVTLRPIVTFAEVEQPLVRFLLRVRQEDDDMPQFTLIEADHAWRTLTIAKIGAKLKDLVAAEGAPDEIEIIA